MKKICILLSILVATFSVSYGQFTKFGGGISYSTGFPFHNMPWDANKSGHINISLKGIYHLSLPIQISPSLTYFVPHVTNEINMKTVVSTIMFDINGHYVFNSLDRFEFYGLAGLDILFAGKKETYTGSSSSKERDNALGLNLGLGTYMKMTEQLDLYAEAKYVLSKYDQFMLNVGILINLDWLKKN
jgi:hypothetical protein